MKTNSLDFDAQALREKILDLAMRGKLVKQDPNDEPASALLEKIKAEKAELVKEKKIKKSKPLPEITDDEKPFHIPDSWKWVRGEDIVSLIGDGLHGTPVFSKEGVPFVNGSNLIDGKISLTKSTKFVSEEEYLKYKKDLLPGTLFLSLNGTLGKVAKYHNEKIVLGKSAGYFSLIDVKMQDFIFYFLQSAIFKKYYDSKYTGSVIKNIPLKALRECIIPLPPLEEQSRIAAKIAQLFALLRKVESSTQQYAKLQTLLKSKVLDLAMRGKLVEQDPNDEPASVLLEKIKAEKEQLIKEKKVKRSKPLPPISDEEKPFEIPDSWEWVRLGDVGLIATGNTPTKNNSDFYGGTTPFIKPADIQNLIINYNTKDFLSEKGEQKGRLAYKNDILVTCIGNLGRNNIINRKVAYNQQINGISPLIVSSSLLHYFMLSSFFISSMYNYASATTLPILNKTKLSNLIIPLPPLAEQSRIVDKIEMIFSLFCKDESSTQQYENL
ncbi:restriction endonuclease subunit S [Lactobacillus johnsonii]|uniref:restriction endonuclease subunit S n=1 Tax=Lactobacillus johnsonii TaxID=33959 RepID=UPI003667FDDA